MSRLGSLTGKLIVLTTGEGAARVLGIFTFAVLARAMGVSGFGVFSFGLSLAMILECFMDLGQAAQVGIRVADDSVDGLRNHPMAATNKILIGTALAAAVAVVMSFARYGLPETATVVLLIVWAAGLSVLDSLRSTARSLDLFRPDSTVNSAESLLRLAGVAALWALGVTAPWAFGVAFAVEVWASVAVFWWYLGRDHRAMLGLRHPMSDRIDLLVSAAPFGIAWGVLSIFYNFDQVMVRAIDGAAANGLYSAAARVSFTASTIGGLLALVVFPELARLRADKASFRTFLVRALALATAVGVATAVAVYFLAGPLMWVLYGPKFMGAVGMLQVLCLVIAFRGTATVALYGANAGGTQKRTVVVAIVFAALSIGADLLLLPRYGAIAAAWVSGIGQLLLAVALVAVSFMWTRSRTRGGPVIVAEGSEADGGGDALI